jgi:O-antigen/teichoic acid export membrane protein
VGEVVSALSTIWAITSLLGIAVGLLYFAVFWLPQYSTTLITLALMIIPINVARSYATGVFLGKEQIARFNSANWLPAALTFFILASLAIWIGLDVRGVLIAQIIGTAVITAYAIWLVATIAPIRATLSWTVTKQLMGLGLVYAAALFVLNANYRVNIFMLQQLSSLEQVGLYALGGQIAELIWQIPAALGALVFSRSANASNPQYFSRKVLVLARVAFLIAVSAGVALAVLGPLLIPLIYGADFQASASILTILLPGIIAFSLFKLINMDLAGKGKPWLALLIVAPCLPINVLISYLVIPVWGGFGAAIACSVSYLVVTVIFVVAYCRVVDVGLLQAITYSKSDLRFLADRVPLVKRVVSRWL